jgi:hypothetical protein
MSEYPYEIIPQDADIRILRIFAGSSGDIICDLKPIRFGSVPYLALSYVWGSYEDPTTMPKIIVQKKTKEGRPSQSTMAVRSNLFGALEQLRHPSKDVYCWADAICIDFENVQERELQLAVARDVYQKAERVMHWLGRQKEYTLNAFKCIRLLRESGLEQKLQAERFEQLLCFQRLLANVWFSRRWIIQEVVFARPAVVFSGSCSIYWSVFMEAAINYFAYQDRIEALASQQLHGEFSRYSTQGAKVLLTVTNSISRQHQPKPWEALRAIKRTSTEGGFPEDAQPEARNVADLSERERRLIEDYERGSAIEYKYTLEELIYLLYPYEVSDYRDTIYAILSLARDTNRQEPTRTGLSPDTGTSPVDYYNIQPDYNKDVFEVFKDFTKYCVRRQPTFSLDVICRPWVPRSIQQIMHPGERSNFNIVEPHPGDILRIEETRWAYSRQLASWMPTTERLAFDYTQSSERKNGDSFVGPPGKSIYHATRSIPAEVSFGEVIQHNPLSGEKLSVDVPRTMSDGTLSARGIQLDSISSLSTRYTGIITGEWLLLGGWSGEQEIPDELWRTIVAGRDPSQDTPFRPGFREASKQALNYRDEHNNIDSISLIQQGDNAVSKFLRRVNDVSWNRRLFRTTKLKRLGLAPSHAAVGDILSVLYGCSVPVVLRKLLDNNRQETGQYQLIGECYLDGMMEGEAVSEPYLEQARRDGSEKVFVLG